MMADATADQQAKQNADDTTRQKLDEQRVEFGNTIKNYFPVLFILTVVIAASLIVLSAVGFVNERTMDATVLAASVQVAFGMVLGFVCVYIGLMMTWIGIDAAYSVEGGVGSGTFVLRSASPGLLFALGGIVLVSVALHKQIVYEESSGKIVDTQPIDLNAMSGGVTPEPPKSMSFTPAEASRPATFSGQIPFNSNQPSATKRADK
jgi:hypothetical protein